jgi:hypothetical protein
MAITNPTTPDFINNQKRGLDPFEYRDSGNILDGISTYFRAYRGLGADSIFDNSYTALFTGFVVEAYLFSTTQILVRVTEGVCSIENQPVVFDETFEFIFDIPLVDTTLYTSVRYQYVNEYPSNYASIVVDSTLPVDLHHGLSLASFDVNVNNLPNVGDQFTITQLAPYEHFDGARFFTELEDTPNNFTGRANNVVGVNSAEDGLEFYDLLIGGTF